MKLALHVWAARQFDPPPANRTLRRWVSNAQIIPAPVKIGSKYYVEPTAKMWADVKAAFESETLDAPPPPPAEDPPILAVWAKTPANADWVLTRRTPRVQIHQNHPDAAASGIYGLFNGGRLVYIGKATNMGARLRRHYMGEHIYDSYACLQLPEHAYSDIEAAHIRALNPPYNRKHEPSAWTGNAAMVALVKAAWGKE